MVDIHSHILWGMDDGAKTPEESSEMLQMAVESGTTDIVATPHANFRYAFDPEVIRQRIQELSGEVAGKLSIHHGCDFHLSFENVQGVITAQYLMDPTDKQWDTHPDKKMWVEWMGKHNPGASLEDASNVFAFTVSFLMHKTLEKCGDNLTRENLMKQAANHHQLKVPLLLPGITVSTSPTDYYPIQAVQLSRFKGETWELFGDIMHAEST